MEPTLMRPIGVIRTDFGEKFGIPRQSGRVPELIGKIVFSSQYRNPDALRGIEAFSHLWILFDFSEAHREKWSPMVRPPRLGGNERVGVFASRSPFRPNPIGLSSVRLEEVRKTENEGTVLIVSGVDMLDKTPIYDIKPYLPFSDIHPDAVGSYADEAFDYHVKVHFPEELLIRIPENRREALKACLREDPRPSYQEDPQRIYKMEFAGFDIHFTVAEGILTVVAVETLS